MGLRINHSVAPENIGAAETLKPSSDYAEVLKEIDKLYARQIVIDEIKDRFRERLKILTEEKNNLLSILNNNMPNPNMAQIAANISAFNGAIEECERWINGAFN